MKKKIFLFLLISAAIFTVNAQEKSTATKKDWSKTDLSNRANDHLMLQYGYDGWSGTNDTISPSGFSRHFNIYFLYDMPFKTSPHFSVAIGAGIGSSNIFFKNTFVNIKSLTATLPFTNVSATNHFDKFKLVTTYLEAPVEFRYASNPVQPDKGFKLAAGLKVGTLLKSYTKGKNWVNANGETVYGKNYVNKESYKKFINGTRLAVTGRFGLGNFSIDGSYQLTSFLKSGAGPAINPYSIGVTLSGL